MPSSKIARFRLHLPNLVSLPGMSAPEVQISAGASCDYRAPRWLPGGHLQTIYPAKFIRPPDVTLNRERWDTPDGDFIDIDFLDGPSDAPLLVLFHGLEGSSRSHYAISTAQACQRAGWRQIGRAHV